MSTSKWMDLSFTSNRYIRSYFNGFVDISGGDLFLRGGNNTNNYSNLYIQNGDISLNGRLMVSNDASLNNRLFVAGDVSFNNRLFVGGDVSINSRLFVGSDTIIYGRLSVNEYNNNFIINTTTSNYTLIIGEDVSLNGRLTVTSDTSLNNRLFVGGDVSLNARLMVNSDVSFNNRLSLAGDSILLSRLIVFSDVSLNNRVFIDGDLSLNQRIFVLGDSSFNGNVYFLQNTGFQGDATFKNRVFIYNDLSLNARLTIYSDVSMNNRLFVGGDVSFNSRLTVSYDVSFNQRLFVGGDVSFNKRLFVNNNITIGQGNTNTYYELDVSGNSIFRGKINPIMLTDNSVLLTNTPDYDFSNNFGILWTRNIKTTKSVWKSIAISSTGQYQIACTYSTNSDSTNNDGTNGYLFTSNDYGLNWNKVNFSSTISPGTETYGTFWTVAISGDGKYQTAYLYNNSTANTYANKYCVFYSNNYGSTFGASNLPTVTALVNNSNVNLNATNTFCYSSAITSNGQYSMMLQYIKENLNITDITYGGRGCSLFVKFDNNLQSTNNNINYTPTVLYYNFLNSFATSATGQYITITQDKFPIYSSYIISGAGSDTLTFSGAGNITVGQYVFSSSGILSDTKVNSINIATNTITLSKTHNVIPTSTVYFSYHNSMFVTTINADYPYLASGHITIIIPSTTGIFIGQNIICPNNPGLIDSNAVVTGIQTTPPGVNLSIPPTGPITSGTQIIFYYTGGNILRSNDYGNSFIANPAPTLASSLCYFNKVAMSSTGQYQAMTASGDIIYLSSNYGKSWIKSNSIAAPWSSIAMSADGKLLAATVFNGLIYFSNNFGMDWYLSNAPTKYWNSIGMSSNGKYITACSSNYIYGNTTNNDYIYNSITPYNNISISNILNVYNDVSFNNRLFVGGDASLNARLTVFADVSFNNRLFIGSDLSINQRLFVKGDASFNGSVVINKDMYVNGRLSVGQYSNDRIINTTTTNYYMIVGEDLSLNYRLFVGETVSIGANTASYPLTIQGFKSSLTNIQLYGIGGAGSTVGINFDTFNSRTGGPASVIKAIDNGSYSNDLTFWTSTSGSSSTACSERLRITSSGNVGINTTSPNSTLDMNGILYFSNVSSTSAPSNGSYTAGIGTRIVLLAGSSSTVPYSLGVDSTALWYSSQGAHKWYKGSTNNMILDSNGYLGINKTAPVTYLDINAAGTTARTGTAPTSYGGLYITAGAGGGTTYPPIAEFRNTDQTQGIAINYNTIFATGSSTNQDLCILARGAGSVGINTTAPSTSYKLDLVGNFRCSDGTTELTFTVGKKGATATTGWTTLDPNGGTGATGVYIYDALVCSGQIEATSFNATSDYRIKTDIKNIIDTSYNDVFNNLRPVFYNNKITNKNHLGFIAHEVQENVDIAVNGEKDAKIINDNGNEIPNYQSVDYNCIIALCVNEIQQLKKRIVELESKIN